MTVPSIKRKSLYEEFPELLEEASMPESGFQHDLGHYLESILRWYYRAQNWYVSGNIYLLEEGRRPISPDIFICKQALTQEEKDNIESWDLRLPNRKVPAVVFEIASDATWQQDLNDKVERYRLMGVEEYFAYDPNTNPVWDDKTTRLKGWRFTNGQTETITPTPEGSLKSESLGLLLTPDKKYLRFFTLEGRPLWTAEQEAEFEKTTRLRLEQENLAAKAAKVKAEAENLALREELERLRQQLSQTKNID